MIDVPPASSAALQLVNLGHLMALTGDLVDGPVAVDHPDFAGATIGPVAGDVSACSSLDSGACVHGTFVAGILVAKRSSVAPAICPGCTLLVRPIFTETPANGRLPTASPDDVGRAIVESVRAGARIVNLSAAAGQPTTRALPALREALDYAARRGTLIVAAAGNQAALGSVRTWPRTFGGLRLLH